MKSLVITILLVFEIALRCLGQTNVVLNKNLYLPNDTIFGEFYIDASLNYSGPISIFLVDENLTSYEDIVVTPGNGRYKFYLVIPQKDYVTNLSLQFFLGKHSEPAFVHPLLVVNRNLPLGAELELDKKHIQDLGINMQTDITPGSEIAIDFDSKDMISLTMAVIDLNLDIASDKVLLKSFEGEGLNSKAANYFSYSFLLLGENGNPLKHEKVLLSSNMDNIMLYQISDNTGRVEFNTMKDLYNSEVQVSLLSHDHKLSSVQLSYQKREFQPFEPAMVNLDQSEIDFLIANHDNLNKIKSAYSAAVRKSFISKDTSKHQLISADYTINLDEYIRFNSFKEIIKEAIPYVFIQKGQLRVFDDQNKKSFAKPPLLLVNNVPVILDSVFTLPYDQIDYIQVINSYSRIANFGTLAENGVVAIYIKDYDPELIANTKRVFIDGIVKDKVRVSSPLVHAPYIDDCLVWKNYDNPSATTRIQFKVPDYQTTLELRLNYFRDGRFHQTIKKIPIAYENSY
jgi:hypothetical protein